VLEASRARLDAIYYCPHDLGQCGCRKPQIGMFLEAQRDFPDIDFLASALVGDSLKDMEAGARLGCRNYLIGPPGTKIPAGLPVHGVGDSLDAVVAEYLLKEAGDGGRSKGVERP